MKLTLNLASRTYLNRRALRFSALAVGAALLLLAAGIFYSYGQAHFRADELAARLAELDQQEQELRGKPRRVLTPEEQTALIAEIEFANATLKMDGFRWTSLLDRLEVLIPPQVSLRGIRPDFAQGSCNLTGQARSVDDLRQFLDALIGSPDFKDVYLLQQARENVETGDGLVAFSIVVKGAF